jgi:hypothetical protein
MAGNESQVIGTELERVLPKVPALFDRDDVFYSTIEKRPVEVISSRDMRIPLEIRPNGNTGYYDPDGGDMGRGDISDFDKAIINSVHLVHRVELTAKTVWSTDNNRKSVLNAFRHALAVGMKQFRRDVDSQCMTDGTGTLGTITTVSTTAGVDTYTCTTDGFGVRLIRSKQMLNVFNSALTTCRTGGGIANETKVTSYDIANKTISVTPSVPGATAGDLLVSDGLQSTPPTGILGVKYHNSNASTGTWQGFDRSINPEIRANRVNANNAALTLPLPRLAMNKIGDRIGINKGTKMTAWTHKAQQAAYEELGFNVIRIDKAAKEEGLDMYFNDNMRIAGAPLKISYSWDRTRIDFIDSEVWGRAELHPPGFYQNPDNNQRVWETRGPSGGVAASWIFYIVASFNLFMNQPAGAAYIDTLAVTSGY